MKEKEPGSGKAAPAFEPCCLPTTIGSMPHTDAALATELVLRSTPEIPAWVQLPQLSPKENMITQFSEGLPGLVRVGDRLVFDTTSPGFVEEVTRFFDKYLAATEGKDPAALEYFGISPSYAAGFRELVSRLPDLKDLVMPKGQVTGPVTMGLNLVDQEGRCAYYDPTLRDVIVKSTVVKAAWQLRYLQAGGTRAMIFLDEPALLGYGSSMFITIGRDEVIGDINEVVRTIHEEGALAGVHCEENTDWSVLMATDLDILDFDAYSHMEAITLYPVPLADFLERGGILGWGIVPTLSREAAAGETVESLLQRFDSGLDLLVSKGFDRKLLLRRALITPSCGMGGVLTEQLAERVLDLLRRISLELRKRL